MLYTDAYISIHIDANISIHVQRPYLKNTYMHSYIRTCILTLHYITLRYVTLHYTTYIRYMPTLHTYTHTRVHTYIYIYLHTYTYICMHTYIHTYTHMGRSTSQEKQARVRHMSQEKVKQDSGIRKARVRNKKSTSQEKAKRESEKRPSTSQAKDTTGHNRTMQKHSPRIRTPDLSSCSVVLQYRTKA